MFITLLLRIHCETLVQIMYCCKNHRIAALERTSAETIINSSVSFCLRSLMCKRQSSIYTVSDNGRASSI